MSAPINPTRPIEPTCLGQVSKIVCATALQTGLQAGFGALAGHIFTIIHPVGGAIFGATYALTNMGLSYGMERLGCSGNSPQARAFAIANWAISTFASIAAAALVTTAAGFPITFTAGVVLAIATVVTTCGTLALLGGSAVLGGCVAGTCILGVASLAARPQAPHQPAHQPAHQTTREPCTAS